MRKKPLAICIGMSTLAAVGYSSTPSVRSNPPPPPAWMMQPAPDLLTPLSGIISLSEAEFESLPNN
ncbi:Rz1 family lipoprotein [Mixta gaviniae]|uniref:Rz1 family lipoprotein n=1 Tax=Mixta gaviniae TaxID=665914 RepID=UPI003CCBBA2C